MPFTLAIERASFLYVISKNIVLTVQPLAAFYDFKDRNKNTNIFVLKSV